MHLFAEHLVMLLKGTFCGFIYNFIGLASALFMSNFVMQDGKSKAIVASIGLSLTNILWAIISAFLFTFALTHLNHNIHIYTFIGSIILLYFAYQIWFRNKKERIRYIKNPQRSERIFLEAVLFGLASPEKILGYGALFALVNAQTTAPLSLSKIPLVLGVGAGSFIWWISYIYLIHGRSQSLPLNYTRIFQKGCACFLGGLSLIGFVSSFVQWMYKN